MRLILRRVRQRPFVLEHLAEITAVDPAATGQTSEEMLGLVLRRIADHIGGAFLTSEASAHTLCRQRFRNEGEFIVNRCNLVL